MGEVNISFKKIENYAKYSEYLAIMFLFSYCLDNHRQTKDEVNSATSEYQFLNNFVSKIVVF